MSKEKLYNTILSGASPYVVSHNLASEHDVLVYLYASDGSFWGYNVTVEYIDANTVKLVGGYYSASMRFHSTSLKGCQVSISAKS